MKIKGIWILLLILLLALGAIPVLAKSSSLTPNEELGKAIFFDKNLSINNNQSCATCHAPEAGWTGSDSMINAHGAVYEGSIPGAFGDRKPPSSAYATQSPVLAFVGGMWVGGNFWDGRATGWTLGSPAAEQAKGPFLNPVEQALPDAATLVSKVCTASYGDLFREIWGAEACDPANVAMAYDSIGYSVAAYEASPEVNAFSSKYDLSFGNKVRLNKLERRGFAVFQGKGKCKLCHVTQGKNALFTDYTFDNLGVPKNPENPVYAHHPDFVDPGLGGFLKAIGKSEAEYMAEWGKHKVPTVRNVGLGNDSFVKAYGHNGYFKSLYGIVHFYNTRDVLPKCPGDYTEAEALAAKCWPEPEVALNVNTAELGDLGLSLKDELALVAFLEALSDGYVP